MKRNPTDAEAWIADTDSLFAQSRVLIRAASNCHFSMHGTKAVPGSGGLVAFLDGSVAEQAGAPGTWRARRIPARELTLLQMHCYEHASASYWVLKLLVRWTDSGYMPRTLYAIVFDGYESHSGRVALVDEMKISAAHTASGPSPNGVFYDPVHFEAAVRLWIRAAVLIGPTYDGLKAIFVPRLVHQRAMEIVKRPFGTVTQEEPPLTLQTQVNT